MSGYISGAQNPIEDGWLNTGDIGFIHQGRLHLRPFEDVIVVRGKTTTLLK